MGCFASKNKNPKETVESPSPTKGKSTIETKPSKGFLETPMTEAESNHFHSPIIMCY